MTQGKQLVRGQAIVDSPLHGSKAPKVMVMATGATAVADVLAAKSDPTVRGFAAEDEAAEKTKSDARELSEWGQPQHPEYKFCRFEPVTWQSFGTRPTSKTPHAFAARQLLLKLAQDPAITAIMAGRKWTVGVLAEMDPLDDRLAEKMEGGGKRLLGYNMNAGSQARARGLCERDAPWEPAWGAHRAQRRARSDAFSHQSPLPASPHLQIHRLQIHLLRSIFG